MKPSYKNKRNDKPYGAKRFGDRFDRRDRREMFDATCTECGDECQVPFRPDGRKPVKCKNCFKRDDSSFDDRGGYQNRDSYQKRERRFTPQTDNSKIETRLAAIEGKLDALIEALTEIGEEEAMSQSTKADDFDLE